MASLGNRDSQVTIDSGTTEGDRTIVVTESEPSDESTVEVDSEQSVVVEPTANDIISFDYLTLKLYLENALEKVNALNAKRSWSPVSKMKYAAAEIEHITKLSDYAGVAKMSREDYRSFCNEFPVETSNDVGGNLLLYVSAFYEVCKFLVTYDKEFLIPIS